MGGLALAGAGGFIALETTLAATGRPFVVIPGRQWLGVLRRTPWSARTVVVVMALILAAGLVLLVAEGRRWRQSRVKLAVPGGNGEWWVSRRSAQISLARQLRSGTGAIAPRCRLDHRRQHWRLTVVAGIGRRGTAGQLEREIEAVARGVLARLGVPEGFPIKVRLRRGGDSVTAKRPDE